MHDGRVMLSGKDVTGPAHVRRELIDLINSVDDFANHGLISQIRDDELVRDRSAVFMRFDIDAANPKAFPFKSLYKMATNESAGATDKYVLTLHLSNLPV